MSLIGQASFDCETVVARHFDAVQGAPVISSGNSLNPGQGMGILFSQNSAAYRVIQTQSSIYCGAFAKAGALGLSTILGCGLAADNFGGNSFVQKLFLGLHLEANGSLSIRRRDTGAILCQSAILQGMSNNKHHFGFKAILASS